MWLYSAAPEDPEDGTVMENHGAQAFYTAGKSLMLAILTEDDEAQQHVVHRMIQIAKPWTIRRWLESRLANAKLLIPILEEKVHVIELEPTEEEQE